MSIVKQAARLGLLAATVLGGQAMALEPWYADEVRRNIEWGEWAFASVAHEEGTPFSFVYGGKPSSELLPTWQRTVQDEPVNEAARRRTLVLRCPKTDLEVRAVCTMYTDTPGIDWTLYFTYRGEYAAHTHGFAASVAWPAMKTRTKLNG